MIAINFFIPLTSFNVFHVNGLQRQHPRGEKETPRATEKCPYVKDDQDIHKLNGPSVQVVNEPLDRLACVTPSVSEVSTSAGQMGFHHRLYNSRSFRLPLVLPLEKLSLLLRVRKPGKDFKGQLSRTKKCRVLMENREKIPNSAKTIKGFFSRDKYSFLIKRDQAPYIGDSPI